MTDYKIEIHDGLGGQAELPLDLPTAIRVPTWEELEALYHGTFPRIDLVQAIKVLQHELDLAQVAGIENEQSKLCKHLAKSFALWVGLTSVAFRERGIGQAEIDSELSSLWRARLPKKSNK